MRVKNIFRQLKKDIFTGTSRALYTRENGHTLHLLMPAGIALSITALIIESAVTGQNAPIEFFFAAGAFIYMELMILLLADKLAGASTFVLYFIISLIMLVGVLADALGSRSGGPFLFMAMLFVLPMLILDTPWHIFLLIIGYSVLFLTLCHQNVSSELFHEDLVLTSCAAIASCLLSLRISGGRIRAVRQTDHVQMQAQHDPLTGLYNTGGGKFLIDSCARAGMSGTFLIMDVDNFKKVNDTCGHKRGDEILCAVARQLTALFKPSDIVMRMGGDEFIVYAVGMVDENVVSDRLGQLMDHFHEIIIDEKAGTFVTVSIGCLINDGSYPGYDSLYHSADRMLYRVKEHGKDGFQILSVSYRGL